jgi:glycosyltransferase involved in cell wall biosynthesis
MEPLVSVLIPVYNAEAHIRASLESVLLQTHANLQVIVVDDGSTDQTAAYLATVRDPRVLIITQNNQGVAAALNKAIESATGKYIARNDSDDISLPGRIKKTVAFLEAHPDYVLVGAWAEIIDANGAARGFLKHPCGNEELQYQMLWDSPFVSSTTLFRSECLKQCGLFYAGKDYFEDFHMWSVLARLGRLANLPEVLIRYRELHTGLSHTTLNTSERIINERRLNLHYRFPQLRADLLEGLALSGFARTPLESLHQLKQTYQTLLEPFIMSGQDPESRKRIAANLQQRMHAFRVFTGEHKKAFSPLQRALEKITYTILLRP